MVLTLSLCQLSAMDTRAAHADPMRGAPKFCRHKCEISCGASGLPSLERVTVLAKPLPSLQQQIEEYGTALVITA